MKTMPLSKRSIHRSVGRCALVVISLVIGWFGFSPGAQSVVPPPDGGYPGGNTAEGQNALFSLTTGEFNTAVGFFSLRSTTDKSFNTALGAGALVANSADGNTAVGAAALLSNTAGFANTATGGFALFSNTTGSFNTASGHDALGSNTGGSYNTADGFDALTGDPNTGGGYNTGVGFQALYNAIGSHNTAIGDEAGSNAYGSNNIYIGAQVFGDFEDNTIHIGDNSEPGFAMQACFVGGIANSTVSGTAVYVDSNGQLGTQTSSKRFKQDIAPMNAASEALFGLQPVTFHYKESIDPVCRRQLGLVAEQVEKVDPDLVVRDKDGKPDSVRYDQVNAMLLNEFLKEHSTVQELKKEVAALTARLKEQDSKLEKVSARLEMSRSASQMAVNRQ
jgi:Chaperone of endosialidase